MTSLIFALGTGNLEAVVLDATLSESHDYSAAITDHPVETGGNVTDHIRANPIKLRLEAMITDFPLQRKGMAEQLPYAVSEYSDLSAASVGRSGKALSLLQQAQEQGVLISVTNTLKQYSDMVIESINVPRTKDLKGALKVTIQLKQIRVVQTHEVKAAKAKTRNATKKVDTGNKDKKPVEDPISAKTLLKHVFSGDISLKTAAAKLAGVAK